MRRADAEAVIVVCSEGSRQADGAVQAVEKSGFADGTRVVQLFVRGQPRPHLLAGEGIVWMTHDEARQLGQSLLALAGEDPAR
jgi:hypothetical protein